MKIKFNSVFMGAILLVSIVTSCKVKDPVKPEISLPLSASVVESNTGKTKLVIPVTLSEATTVQVSCKWSTIENSAKKDEDFVPVSGQSLVFEPGETTKNIEVEIVNDTIYESDEIFGVEISSVTNGTTLLYRTAVTITNDDAYMPTLKVDKTTVLSEGTASQMVAKVKVVISPEPDKPVTVQWSTVEGTAKAGSDFVAVSNASLQFAVGETQKTIDVQLVNDDIMEFNESFSINIASVSNVMYTPEEIKVTINNDDSYTPQLVSDGYITPDTYEGMDLVWSDEFEGTSINMEWWTHEIGGGGWGNNELQSYTNSSSNSYVENGKLNIVAQKYGTTYTSARMVTKGKREFTYGRIDIRAKMPYGQGIWPALWMLGGNIGSVSWPACGEIDIMEYLGHDVAKIYGTVHYDKNGHQYTGGSSSLASGDGYDQKFHIFTIVWQQSGLTWYRDYIKYFEVSASAINYAAFTLPQFFIFNVAVGGNWPGNPNSSTVFPQTMQVDYVRVFQPN